MGGGIGSSHTLKDVMKQPRTSYEHKWFPITKHTIIKLLYKENVNHLQ